MSTFLFFIGIFLMKKKLTSHDVFIGGRRSRHPYPIHKEQAHITEKKTVTTTARTGRCGVHRLKSGVFSPFEPLFF